MSAERKMIDIPKIEELLSQVRGVMAVRVVLEEQGQIDELHIVGSPERSAKQMVRDIESLLFVRGGVRVDHRKISLVQIAESAIQPVQVRVRLLDISRSNGDPATMTVVLGMDNQRVQGVGRSRPDHSDQSEHLAGYATIHALDQLIGARGQFRLENMERKPFGQIRSLRIQASLSGTYSVLISRDMTSDAADRWHSAAWSDTYFPINARLPIHKVDSIDLLENCPSPGLFAKLSARARRETP